MIESLFKGELLRGEGEANALLLQSAREVVAKCFGPSPENLSSQALVEGLTQARADLVQENFRMMSAQALLDLGLPLQGLRLDALRLRAVSPGLEKVKAAAPVFYAHRDTWYGNAKCQINAWLPLQPVNEANSFCFYPQYFDRLILNDSEDFCCRDFADEGGFGRVEDAPRSSYPQALERIGGDREVVIMSPPQMLLFSAAHLHQTLVNRSSKIRFSIDFRFFYEEHLKSGQGAPDPDNRSQGVFNYPLASDLLP